MLDDLLEQIADMSRQDPALRDRYIFLGDYVDRGPHSNHVIDRLCTLSDRHDDPVFLLGNHEEMMLKSLLQGDERSFSAWMINGGEETLASYGVAPPRDLFDDREFQRCRRELDAALPDRHRRFLDSLVSHQASGGYIFAHAGLRPGIPIEDQEKRDLIWIRHQFLDSDADFGGVVVHGHTPAFSPEIRPNRINLDTGAGKGGYLTAGLLWGTWMAFLHAGQN